MKIFYVIVILISSEEEKKIGKHSFKNCHFLFVVFRSLMKFLSTMCYDKYQRISTLCRTYLILSFEDDCFLNIIQLTVGNVKDWMSGHTQRQRDESSDEEEYSKRRGKKSMNQFCDCIASCIHDALD